MKVFILLSLRERRQGILAYHSTFVDHRLSAVQNLFYDVFMGGRFFDLLLSGEDIRRQPLIERKKALKWVLRKAHDGIQYVEHTEGDGEKMFAVCKLGLEGIVSKKLDAPYRSGPSKTWIKVKNPKAPAATRAVDGAF